MQGDSRNDFVERRKARRAVSVNLVECALIDDADETALTQMGKTLNISELGALLEVAEPFAELFESGQMLDVRIALRDEILSAGGKIVRRTAQPDGSVLLGISFREISDADLKAIRQHIGEAPSA